MLAAKQKHYPSSNGSLSSFFIFNKLKAIFVANKLQKRK